MGDTIKKIGIRNDAGQYTYTEIGVDANNVDIDSTTLDQKILTIEEDITKKVDKVNAVSKTIYGDTTISLGRKADTTVGTKSIAFGDNVTASGKNSFATGDSTTASGDNSHAEGYGTTAYEAASHAEGNSTTAYGMASHAEGNQTTAGGDNSHAEGNNTTASGTDSHAEGYGTYTSGHYSHAEGSETTAYGMASHAEGSQTTASGTDSHAEGNNTTASSAASHAEGENTTASGDYSHAEGYSTNKKEDITTISTNNTDIINAWETNKFSLAKGAGSHVEGKDCLALGDNSHAEGNRTIAIAQASHVEGYSTYTSGHYSHAEGSQTTAYGAASHAEGNQTTAGGTDSHAEGNNTTASSAASHAEGENTTASGDYSHAEGYSTNKKEDITTISTNNTDIINAWETNKFSLAKGAGSHVEGKDCLALEISSHAEGFQTIASRECSHAEGCYTTASAGYSHAEGCYTTASGTYSHAEGLNTLASGSYAHVGGYYTEGCGTQYVIGCYNQAKPIGYPYYRPTSSSDTSSMFIIGNGLDNSSRSNAFRVTFNGATYAKAAYNSTGADYAEFAEWADGNTENEDRRGFFVTFDEEKPNMIRKANEGDYILGIISGNPCIVGNSDESWLGRYVFDEFGSVVYEEKDLEIKYIDEETGERKSKIEKCKTYKFNPNYDPNQEYIHRSERPEWDYVGWMGVLSVRDDGSCKVGGYCKATDGGIATNAERGIDTYRVIERVNDNVIKVALK